MLLLKNLFILIPFFLYGYQNSITNYKAINKCVEFNAKEHIAIRSFKFNKKKVFLIVDTQSLKTGIILQNSAIENSCTAQIANSRYIRLLKEIKSQPNKLENSGITSIKSGVLLTTDLCPSHKKGFEARLYKALIKYFPNPVPVTVFITKRWINKHKKAFLQLKRWNKEKKLSITWGNHTALHRYLPKRDLKHNFVLLKNEHFIKDVLDLETALLQNGALPSVFFRFPGLVSDKKRVLQVCSLGLITIGTNAWLAKGEKIKEGSIILLHGNKNEPKGVDIFLRLLRSGKKLKINAF